MASRRLGAAGALYVLAFALSAPQCATGASGSPSDAVGTSGGAGGSGAATNAGSGSEMAASSGGVDVTTSSGSTSGNDGTGASGGAGGADAIGATSSGIEAGPISTSGSGSTLPTSASGATGGSGSSGNDAASASGGGGGATSGGATSGGATSGAVSGGSGAASGGSGVTSSGSAGSETGVSAGSGATGDASCVASSVAYYCTSIPALAAPPVIDGLADCGPTATTVVPQGWSGPAPLPPLPVGNSAALAVAWRPNGLYIFVSVTTPAAIPANPGAPPFQGAGVELFVDGTGVYSNAPMYNAPGTIQFVVEAPPSGSTSARTATKYRNAVDQGPWLSSQFGTFPTARGFNLEAFISAADLGLSTWTLASGSHVGLDISVDVSFATAGMTGPDGHRMGQYFYHVGAAAPYADPRAFCAPVLSAP